MPRSDLVPHLTQLVVNKQQAVFFPPPLDKCQINDLALCIRWLIEFVFVLFIKWRS